MLLEAGRVTVTISGKDPFSVEFLALETSGRILRLTLEKPLTREMLGSLDEYHEMEIETREYVVRDEFWSPGQCFYDGKYDVDFLLSKTAVNKIQMVRKET